MLTAVSQMRAHLQYTTTMFVSATESSGHLSALPFTSLQRIGFAASTDDIDGRKHGQSWPTATDLQGCPWDLTHLTSAHRLGIGNRSSAVSVCEIGRLGLS